MSRNNYLDDELVLRVEASEKTLLMFVNWIYSGEIRFLEFGGTPKPSLSLSCWHRSSIFVTACEGAMHMAKMGKSDLYANHYQADMKYYDSFSLINHQGTPQCHMEWLIELHLFAVKYDIDLLCEDALHALSIAVSVSNELPGWALVDKAYNKLKESSPLCQFLLKIYTTNWSYTLATDLSSRKDPRIHHAFSNSLICDLSLTLEGNKRAHAQERETLEMSNNMQFLGHALETCELKKQLADTQAELANLHAKIAAREQEKCEGAGIESPRGHEDGEGILTRLLRTSSLSSIASSKTMF